MTLALALVLDAILGEPRWLWSRLPHPVVAMGRAVEAMDRAWNRGGARRAKGAAAAALLVGAAAAVGWAVAFLGPVAEVVLAAILLAQRSLCDHVRAVAAALRVGEAEGRRAVAMIVGRDTAAMKGPDVARAAIESAAENLSDGVVAPAFWFAVAGLPGMMAYKALNTADSTIGYRTERHRDFGWAAARADDAANWIPARLTMLLIAAVAWVSLRNLGADARLHRSPNAGWPEAAMARALDVALAGPRSYEGAMADLPWVNGAGRRNPGPADIERGIGILWRVWALLAVAALCAALL